MGTGGRFGAPPPAAAPAERPAVDAVAVAAAVREVAEPIARALGAQVDRVEFRRAGRRGLVQVFIDTPSGVTLDECAAVSRELSATLDVHDVVPGAYTLEVSSPGLDRPLDGRADFERHAGRLASIVTRAPVEGRSKIVGVLQGLEGEDVVVEEAASGTIVRVALPQVARARLEVEA